MKNIYHSDIYKFEKPVNSYWEDTVKENLNLKRLTENVKSEVVVIGVNTFPWTEKQLSKFAFSSNSKDLIFKESFNLFIII